ncbi:MAG: hypothetical protein ACLSGF_08430 [Alistipes onderdonkii]
MLGKPVSHVTLKEDAQAIDDVIVVAFGTTTKKRLLRARPPS